MLTFVYLTVQGMNLKDCESKFASFSFNNYLNLYLKFSIIHLTLCNVIKNCDVLICYIYCGRYRYNFKSYSSFKVDLNVSKRMFKCFSSKINAGRKRIVLDPHVPNITPRTIVIYFKVLKFSHIIRFNTHVTYDESRNLPKVLETSATIKTSKILFQ